MSVKKIKGHPADRTAPAATASAAGFKGWQIDIICCLVLFVAVFAMFYEIPLEGKAFSRGDDTESAASMNQFAKQEGQTRGYPMWCPYVFGGFPGLAAGAYSNYEYMGMPYALAGKYFSPRYWADLITVNGLLLGGANDQSAGGRWLVALFFYGGLLAYLLMRRLGFHPLISLMAGLLMAWNPYLVSLATAAHGGKMMTFIYMPLVILAAWNVLEKRRLLDFAILALAYSWQIAVGGHTQILFYSLITVGILYVVWAIFELRENKSILVLKPAGMILGAILLGFMVGSLWYIPLAKYVGFSIRGMGPAIAQAGTAAAGYSMKDATMWSFHPREILTFIVPSWYGLKSPFYWGDMPFTSSSFYFGIVPLLFAVLAFFGRKDRLFWGLVAVTVFSFLLSFGSHFESFYGFFFNVLPFFNKFRTPSLILLLVMLAGIIFAGYGLRFVMNLEPSDAWKKRFLYGAIVCAALLVIFLLAAGAFSGLFGSFSKPGEEAQYQPEQIRQLRDMRFDMLRKDLLFTLFFLAAAFAACWAFLSSRIRKTAFLVIILALTAVDLWRFSHQFFDPQPASSTLETLEPNQIVRKLREDKSIFRVMPVGRLMQDNRWAAWEIASLGGYHGAKMRSYQDLVENVMFASPDRRQPLNMGFLSAMNCKYLIAEGQLPETMYVELVAQDPAARWVLYRNPRALERVFFADSILVIPDRVRMVETVRQPNFHWDNTAVVETPLPGPSLYHFERKAEITEYTPHRVRISAHTPNPSLMILSDAYYGPGWTALDNGRPTTIYKVNGFVRGVYLGAGDHTVDFIYSGTYENRGETVATVSHFLVWGLLLGGFFLARRNGRKEQV